jgi:hypothetical protein
MNGFEGQNNNVTYFRAEAANDELNSHNEVSANIGTCNDIVINVRGQLIIKRS